jgi:hypothetical protein
VASALRHERARPPRARGRAPDLRTGIVGGCSRHRSEKASICRPFSCAQSPDASAPPGTHWVPAARPAARARQKAAFFAGSLLTTRTSDLLRAEARHGSEFSRIAGDGATVIWRGRSAPPAPLFAHEQSR